MRRIKQNANHKKQQATPELTSQPQDELTDEQLRQVVGGKKKDPQLAEELERVAHLPSQP